MQTSPCGGAALTKFNASIEDLHGILCSILFVVPIPLRGGTLLCDTLELAGHKKHANSWGHEKHANSVGATRVWWQEASTGSLQKGGCLYCNLYCTHLALSQKLGVPQTWLFQTWLFALLCALFRPFATFCALLRTCVFALFCAHLRSFARICVFLRPTAFKTTAFGNSRKRS